MAVELFNSFKPETRPHINYEINRIIGLPPRILVNKIHVWIAIMKLKQTTNLNNDLPKGKTKNNQQTLDDELKSSKHLIARIEQERDYFHTCINSQY